MREKDGFIHTLDGFYLYFCSGKLDKQSASHLV